MKTTLISFIILLLPSFALCQDNDIKLGKVVYEETCISCHGIDGSTNPQMKLVVQPRKLNKTILTQEQSFQVIKHGAHFWGAHSEIMPAFQSVYTEKQIRNVAAYINQEFNSHRTQKVKKLLVTSEQLSAEDKKKRLKVGGKIFKRRCSWCHGVTGDGQSKYVEASKENQDLIYPYNLTKTLLSEEQIFLYAKYGGAFWGTAKNDMPSWKKKYNDIQLKSVAYFIETQIKKK